jgi:Carboxypeptidase regulatory-like domain
MHGDGTQLLTMVSEANGEFNFTRIPAGSYLVIVNAKGFAPFTSAEFAVAVQQAYEVPDVSLSITTANMEVTVRPTELIAAEQLRAEEKQRLIGVIPNFYTSYIHDAAPSLGNRNSRSLHGTLTIPLSSSASPSVPASRRRRMPMLGTGKVPQDIANVMLQGLSMDAAVTS